MSDIPYRLKRLGEKFRGRMEDWRLAFALDYIDFNEVPLGFDTLCTYMYEDEIALTADEYEEIIGLASTPGMMISDSTKLSLKSLIRQ